MKNIYVCKVTLIRNDFKEFNFYIDYASNHATAKLASNEIRKYIDTVKSMNVINYRVQCKPIISNRGGESWQ